MPFLVGVGDVRVPENPGAVLMIEVVLFECGEFAGVLLVMVLPLQILLLVKPALDVLEHEVCRHAFLFYYLGHLVAVKIVLG